MAEWRLVRWPAGFVIETFRGTSSLIQLYWAFYVLPFFGIQLSPLVAGVLVLGINEGSYFSEVVRAAFGTVLSGQRDAVISLHLPPRYRFFRIMLPQALPLMIPPFGNSVVGMLKFSSLVSLVTLQDLSFRAGMIRASLGDSGAVYGLTLLIYFLLSLLLIAGVTQLERIVNLRAGRALPVAAVPNAPKRRNSSVPAWAFGR
jgi:polar amino acid transport system permease protein